jgi:cytochrome P450
MLLASFAAQNPDPARFDDPDELRLGRPAGHVAFSHGVHYCLGAPLARMAADVAIRTLLARVRGISLAVPAAELRWRPGLLMHGCGTCPCRSSPTSPGHRPVRPLRSTAACFSSGRISEPKSG